LHEERITGENFLSGGKPAEPARGSMRFFNSRFSDCQDPPAVPEAFFEQRHEIESAFFSLNFVPVKPAPPKI
jgi:hypothetical protein